MRRDNRSTRGKTSHGRVEDQQTQSTYCNMTPSAEIAPGPHWWKASALTTRPTLPPWKFDFLKNSILIFCYQSLAHWANICFKKIKCPRGSYQRVVLRQKHSIVSMVFCP